MSRGVLYLPCCMLYALVFLGVQSMTVEGHRILMIPMFVKSHVEGQVAIAMELSRRGHDVHMFYPSEMQVPDEIAKSEGAVVMHIYERPSLDTTTDFEEVHDNITRMLLTKTGGVQDVLNYLLPLAAVECHRILEHNERLFEKLDRLKFDIAIVDGLFTMKCFYLVPHRLRIPWITHTDMVEPWLVRVPWLTSFVPISLVALSDTMTFSERVYNTFIQAMLSLAVAIPGPTEQVLDRYRSEFGYFRDLDELVANSSFWITSRHSVSDHPKPSMPNMIDAGGLTVKPSTKPLPPKLAEFVNGAERGVVLVTFGSMASSFPREMSQKFIECFRVVSQYYRIVWRFNNTVDKIVMPRNVFVSNWLPQNDLLAHPKVVLFITHGGNNGQMEAIYHAKPMIGFPLNGDQPYNVRRMAHKGYGVELDIHSFTPDLLVRKIHEVVQNPTYKEKVALASEIFRSDLQRPAEKAAWWVEHVIKFGGDYLRSGGNDLAWFQYWLLDVIAFVVFVIISILVAAFLLCKCVYRQCCGKVTDRQETEKKNQ